MSDKMREAFDAWRSSNGWQRPDDPGEWEAWQAALAQRPTDEMLDEMRHRGLSIDGDNAYKRDLIDCIIGALACGKQNTNPPPVGHWAQRFWEIGRAEGEIQETASTQAAPAPAAQEPIKLSSDMHEFLQEWISSALEDDDHDFADQLAVLLGPIYTAPPAAEQPDSKYRCPSCHEPVSPPSAWSAQVRCAACGKASAATASLSCAERPDTVQVPRELLSRHLEEIGDYAWDTFDELHTLLGKEGV